MTAFHPAPAPDLQPRGLFTGLDVADAAGLRLIPGYPHPVFDQDIWDLTGLEGAPVIMGTHRKMLDFTTIHNPQWRRVAREYLMARLAPRHPAVVTLPKAIRSPIDPHSLWQSLRSLAAWFNYLTGAGMTRLDQVGQHHCDAFLAVTSTSEVTPGRVLAPATLTIRIRATQMLTLYSEILSDCYQSGFVPWRGRSVDEIAGYIRPEGNSVSEVADAVLRPALAGAFYLLDTIAPLLTQEAAAVRAADEHEAASLQGLAAGRVHELKTAIELRVSSGTSAPRISANGRTRRLRTGWAPDDPLLDMAWHPVVVETMGAMGHRRDLERLRPVLQRWVRECGLQEPWARDASLVPRHDNGEPTPWTRPLSRTGIDHLTYVVTSASFLATSALTGMRSSELAELAVGCRRQEPRVGGGYRHRLVTRKIKGERFGGIEDAWVVIEDVHRAIATAETLSALPPGELLFSKASNNAFKRMTALREWINSEDGQRLGLDSIPDGPLNPRALRRTLALAIAARPHGLMAAKVALKHVSVAASEGYAARPGGQQAAFLADVTAAEEAEHLRLAVAAYEDYTRGVLPTGKGARDLIAAFHAVDKALNRHDPGPVTVIDDRRVERILRAKAQTLHLGIGNYCWFTDPAKALCLTLAGTPDRTEPLLGMCDSARCPQATHHPRHRQVWAEHAAATKTVFLGNPRLSPLERTRAQNTYDRAARVIAEIDQAAKDQENHDGE